MTNLLPGKIDLILSVWLLVMDMAILLFNIVIGILLGAS